MYKHIPVSTCVYMHAHACVSMGMYVQSYVCMYLHGHACFKCPYRRPFPAGVPWGAAGLGRYRRPFPAGVPWGAAGGPLRFPIPGNRGTESDQIGNGDGVFRLLIKFVKVRFEVHFTGLTGTKVF